jgi:hypothetical protein
MNRLVQNFIDSLKSMNYSNSDINVIAMSATFLLEDEDIERDDKLFFLYRLRKDAPQVYDEVNEQCFGDDIAKMFEELKEDDENDEGKYREPGYSARIEQIIKDCSGEDR